MAPCSSVHARAERPLFRERQSVMATARGMIQHRARFAVPISTACWRPSQRSKVAVNVTKRTLGSKDIADDGCFRAGPALPEAVNIAPIADARITLSCSHFDPFLVSQGAQIL